jgi:Tfp pilus assembly protein PilV
MLVKIKMSYPILFRKNLRSIQGLTLTELIIAAVLVSIIFAGALSVEYAVRNSRGMASKDALLAMSTAATMLQITRDANIAVGDASDPGMVSTADGFCLRQDRNTPATAHNYTDDSWVCYSRLSQNIHRCVKASGSAASSCQGADPVIGTAVFTAGEGSKFIPQIVINFPQGIYLDISLTNRPNPTAALDPIDNPDLTLQSRIYPLGHGF